jgi:ppGpp synthetase/RelA/SpoT-type nucleotidyltranferase
MAKRVRTSFKKINEDAIAWYESNLQLHKDLGQAAKNTVELLLQANVIPFDRVVFRVKSFESFKNKIDKKKYKNPKSDIKDVIGLRVVLYFKSDVKKVSRIIEENFTIDPFHSIDKSAALGVDRVGYRSVHYITKFSDARAQLIENKRFEGIFFEIQMF